jgi:hypothetical protein
MKYLQALLNIKRQSYPLSFPDSHQFLPGEIRRECKQPFYEFINLSHL